MQIRARLLASFLFLTLLIAFQFVTTSYVAHEQDDLLRQMVHEHELSNKLSALALAAHKIRRFEKEYFIYVTDEEKRNAYYLEFQAARGDIEKYLRALRTIYTLDGDSAELERLTTWQMAAAYYTESFEIVHREVLSGRMTTAFEANAAIKEGKNRFRELLTGAEQAIDRQLELARDNASRINAYQDDSMSVFSIVTAVSLLLALVISLRVPRSICKPLRDLTELADGISKGRINVPVKVTGSQEIEELSKSVERLRIAVRGLLLRVQKPRGGVSRRRVERPV
jgi:methyl-accepting chemotaxis protein